MNFIVEISFKCGQGGGVKKSENFATYPSLASDGSSSSAPLTAAAGVLFVLLGAGPALALFGPGLDLAHFGTAGILGRGQGR